MMMKPKTSRKKEIRLSPSALNIFRDCQHCFWMDKVQGIRRPRGIFPSLPSGMDRVIKDYFDQYRKEGNLPPEFQSETFQGLQLYDNQKQLNLWREWRTGPSFRDEDGSVLFGAIDDLLVKEGKYVPFDCKKKGSPTSAEDARRYYSNQIDCYALMLEKNGLPQAGCGYLLYYSPKSVREKGWVNFNLQAVRLETDTARALKTFRDAVALIKSEAEPPAGTCEYCTWISKFQKYQSASREQTSA